MLKTCHWELRPFLYFIVLTFELYFDGVIQRRKIYVFIRTLQFTEVKIAFDVFSLQKHARIVIRSHLGLAKQAQPSNSIQNTPLREKNTEY